MKNNIDFKEIHSVSGNILTKAISLIYMLDYASIYRAILSKTDPSPVSSIDYIKSRIWKFLYVKMTNQSIDIVLKFIKNRKADNMLMISEN